MDVNKQSLWKNGAVGGEGVVSEVGVLSLNNMGKRDLTVSVSWTKSLQRTACYKMNSIYVSVHNN